MRRKSIFSLLCAGLAFCSSLVAQTYKLGDMTEAEFEAGSNTHFRFDLYQLETGTYGPLGWSEGGRVNYYDFYWPCRFQGDLITSEVGGSGTGRQYFVPLTTSWAAAEIAEGEPLNNATDPLNFMYVGRFDNEFETYPTLKGTAAISFVAPSEAYYKITTTILRQDQMAGGNAVKYLMAKFRFRQDGATSVLPTMTFGQDVQYGIQTEDGETYDALGSGGTATRTYRKPEPVNHEFYVRIKAGDMVTAESDLSHMYGQAGFLNADSYVVREGWARTRWSQFEVEVVTKEEAESATGRFVDPYDDETNGQYIDLFKDLFNSFADELDAADMNSGYGEGQYSPEDVEAMRDRMLYYGPHATNDDLIGMMAKALYEQMEVEIEEFRSKINTTDWTAEGNYILFGVPTADPYYNDTFIPQFEKTQPSVWDFKSYSPSSGIYNAIENLGTDNMGGTNAWSDVANEWFYIAQDGWVHPTTEKSPAVVFTAPADGVYKASTAVMRNQGAGNNTMYTRYRFAKGGITNAMTMISKESFLFSDPYGYGASSATVSRIFYVNLKAGDALTFEEDCYTANTNGSAGTEWVTLNVIKLSDGEAEEIIENSPDSYADPYTVASDFAAMDSVLNAVNNTLAAAKVDDEKLGAYPELAKVELEDELYAAVTIREDPVTTQFDLDLAAGQLEEAHALFLTKQNVRIENNVTFTSGAYYIEMDGLYLTTDTCWVSGTALTKYYAHLEPLIEERVKNNQVFNIQFNETYTDPYRFTFTTSLKGETWDLDGGYHITEKGEIRDGGTTEAQSDTGSNHTWRNHTLIYNGTHWCIYNVHNNWSIVFSDDLNTYPTTISEKKYLYKLVAIGDIAVEDIESSATDTQINVISNEAGVLKLNSNKEIEAEIRNVGGSLVQRVKLGSGEVKVSLSAGLYFVVATDGTVEKAIVL